MCINNLDKPAAQSFQHALIIPLLCEIRALPNHYFGPKQSGRMEHGLKASFKLPLVERCAERFSRVARYALFAQIALIIPLLCGIRALPNHYFGPTQSGRMEHGLKASFKLLLAERYAGRFSRVARFRPFCTKCSYHSSALRDKSSA